MTEKLINKVDALQDDESEENGFTSDTPAYMKYSELLDYCENVGILGTEIERACLKGVIAAYVKIDEKHIASYFVGSEYDEDISVSNFPRDAVRYKNFQRLNVVQKFGFDLKALFSEGGILFGLERQEWGDKFDGYSVMLNYFDQTQFEAERGVRRFLKNSFYVKNKKYELSIGDLVFLEDQVLDFEKVAKRDPNYRGASQSYKQRQSANGSIGGKVAKYDQNLQIFIDGVLKNNRGDKPSVRTAIILTAIDNLPDDGYFTFESFYFLAESRPDDNCIFYKTVLRNSCDFSGKRDVLEDLGRSEYKSIKIKPLCRYVNRAKNSN